MVCTSAFDNGPEIQNVSFAYFFFRPFKMSETHKYLSLVIRFDLAHATRIKLTGYNGNLYYRINSKIISANHKIIITHLFGGMYREFASDDIGASPVRIGGCGPQWRTSCVSWINTAFGMPLFETSRRSRMDLDIRSGNLSHWYVINNNMLFVYMLLFT